MGIFIELVLLCVILFLWYCSNLPFKMFKGILIAVFVMFLLLTIINFIMYKSPSFSLVEPESYLFNFYNFSSIQINGKMFYYNTDFR
jgi:hypothetical protein